MSGLSGAEPQIQQRRLALESANDVLIVLSRASLFFGTDGKLTVTDKEAFIEETCIFLLVYGHSAPLPAYYDVFLKDIKSLKRR